MNARPYNKIPYASRNQKGSYMPDTLRLKISKKL